MMIPVCNCLPLRKFFGFCDHVRKSDQIQIRIVQPKRNCPLTGGHGCFAFMQSHCAPHENGLFADSRAIDARGRDQVVRPKTAGIPIEKILK
jgi:hypothetical protein